MVTNAWLSFADICRGSFSECTFQDTLIAECGGSEDLAWAVFYRLGNASLAWMNHNIPALDHAMPADLIRSGNANNVRSCLLRMP